MAETSTLATRYPDFRRFLAARFFWTIGIQSVAVVVAYQVFEITQDPLSLGLIGLAEAIPAISIALPAGFLADRRSRRSIMVAQLILLASAAFALILFQARMADWKAAGTVWPFYLVTLATGIARGFMSPASFAFLTQLVPKQAYPSSSAWSSTVWQTAAVLGPAIAGLLLGKVNARAAYMLALGALLIALVFVASIAARPLLKPKEKEPFVQSLRMGLRFVFRTEIVLGALSLDLFAVLFGGAVALLPAFAEQVLQVGPEGYGYLRAAPSAGALIVAGLLTFRPPTRQAGRWLLVSVAGFGASMLGFALSESFWLSMVMLFLSGGFDSVSVVIRSIILQLYTPDEMRGRVSSVNMMFIGSSNEIGAFESGITAKWFGLVPSVVIGGSLTLLVVAVTAVKAPKLRKLSIV